MIRLGAFSIEVKSRHSTVEQRWPPDRVKLGETLSQALDKSGTERQLIGMLLAELADSAAHQWLGYRRGRHAWRLINYVLGGVSVIASAVGGSILVTNQLFGSTRWIVGGASLLAGVVGGLSALLTPAEEWQTARLKARLYEAFWRDTWHYALVSLPSASLESAARELTARSQRFIGIGITTFHTHDSIQWQLPDASIPPWIAHRPQGAGMPTPGAKVRTEDQTDDRRPRPESLQSA